MILTVKEAATKRCQEGFAASNGVMLTSDNPVSHMVGAAVANFGSYAAVEQGPSAPFNCIGPKCMAWCWVHDRTIDGDPIGFCGKVHK